MQKYIVRMSGPLARRVFSTEVVAGANSGLTPSIDASLTPVSEQPPTIPSHRKLNMVIAESKLFSRRQAEGLIQQRRVTVAGKVISSPQHPLSDYESNLIEIDGVPLRSKYNTTWPQLWAVRKFKDEVMSGRDPNKSRQIFLDRVHNFLLKEPFKTYGPLKPVYRLGYKTEGFTLFTNSGELAQLLSNDPVNPLQVHFKVRVHGLINDSKLEALREGVFIDNKRYRVDKLERLPPFDKTNSWFNVSLSNFNRQPRALQLMFGKLHLETVRTICTGFGPYKSEDYFPIGKSPVGEKTRPEPLSVSLKLPPELHAMCLRHMNARHVLQMHHKPQSPSSQTQVSPEK